MMKKILSVLLSSLLLLALLAGCSGKTDPEQAPEPFSEPEAGTEEIPDFLGYDFVLDLWGPHISGFHVTEDPGYVDEQRNARLAETEKRFNCTVSFACFNEIEDITADLMAGNLSSMLSCNMRTMYSWAAAGFLAPLDTLEAIDLLDPKWGGEEKLKMLKIGGHQYGSFGSGSFAWNPYVHYSGALLYNPEVISRFGGADPHEEYEQKQWTFDHFLELVKLYYDGSEDERCYSAVYSVPDILGRSAVFANGGSFLKEENGVFSSGIGEQAVVTGLEWAAAVIAAPETVLDEARSPLFLSGQAAFFFANNSLRGTEFHSAGDGSALSTMKALEFSPMPCGPDAEYGSSGGGYYSADNGGTGICPDGEEDSTAVVFDYLFSDPYGGEYPGYFERNNFFTETSFRVFENEIRNARADYTKLFGDNDAKLKQAINAVLDGNAAASSEMEKLTSVFEEMAQELSRK